MATDATKDQIVSAYGTNFERLQKIKAKYDPSNFFRMNQNIPPVL
jgi:FAD/FMN-containing dehydrogenase